MPTNFRAGFRRLADPKISLASMASIFLGASAASGTRLHAGWLILTVLGIFAIEVAKNASGEIFDFDSGTDPAVSAEDRSPFSGGKRVLVDGLLTRAQTAGIAIAGYAAGIAVGLIIVVWREPWIFAWGVLGVVLAYQYNAPPLKLAYRGLGEAAVAFCYGPLIATGTFLVQRGAVTWEIVALSLPLGLLIGGFLWINEFPDYSADKLSSKNNLVVRTGRWQASRWFAMIEGSAFIMLFLSPMTGVSVGAWLGGIALVPAALAAYRLWLDPEDTRHIIPAQGQTLLAFLLYSLGAGLGLLVA